MSKFDIPVPELPRTNEGKRICQVVKVKPEALKEYKECHAAVWPGVLAVLRQAHIVDYSIHYFEPLNLLIAHMRYIGKDYEKDMAVIAADPETHKWWETGCKRALCLVRRAVPVDRDGGRRLRKYSVWKAEYISIQRSAMTL